MRRGLSWVPAVVEAAGAAAGGAVVHMVVADQPYAPLWAAALGAVDGYPLERAAGEVIETGPAERPPRPEEGAFERVAERVTLRVSALPGRVTRVTVTVRAEGWRQGRWAPGPDGAVTARAVLDRIRDAAG